jgi:multidrug efflux pump subunit AcrA (membrane-fusion protein)
MANTEEEQLEAALQQLQQAQEQMEDIQRELQAMEGQEQTEEQQRRQQQLAQQQQQIQEQMQQAQETMQRQDNQQPGQQPGEGEAENQEARAGGRESNREIDRLWLGMLDTMDYRPGNRSNPFPNYEFVIRDLEKLEAALEERLNTLQEKKQLTQVAKEDVPPEYRRLVDNYYESLSQ